MTRLRDTAADVTDDAILNGRLRLYQPKRGHRFGHDAILLAAAVPAQTGQRVAEFGAGVGAASLALLSRVPGIDATLFEIDDVLCALARDNIARNGFAERARVIPADIAALPAEPPFDHVLMNPPFNDTRHPTSPDPARRRAHMAAPGLLALWVRRAQGSLREAGMVTLIWRAEGLAEILEVLADGFGAVAILPVYPAPGLPAIRVIAQAEKGGRARLRIVPPLLLNDEERRPSATAEAILRSGASLPLTEA
jgi:tRNA1(Val) A37 N6-methylase TrmN6